MKLKFQPNLQYQNDAVNSIVDIFKGQQSRQSNFTVLDSKSLNQEQQRIGEIYTDTGIGNGLDLTYDDILENVRNIQMRNNLKRSEKLAGMNFTVEMETGTGKTYTGLGAVVRLFEEKKRLAIIIVCPYQHLVEQWVEDIELFNMTPTIGYSASKQKNWKMMSWIS